MMNMNTIRSLERSEQIALRKTLTGNVETLSRIYREQSSPAVTVTLFIEAVGPEAASVTVASLVNQRGTFDGRISSSTRQWAASIDGALDEDAAQEMGIYTASIHPAHLEQIARSTIRQTTPTDPTDDHRPTGGRPAEVTEIAPDHITHDGTVIPAEWCISYTGRSVHAFATIDGDTFRVTFTSECGELFTAALAAAKRGETTPVDGDDLAIILGTATLIPKKQKPAEPNPDKQRHGEVPDKWFIGQALEGKSWRIFFDGDAGKTRVIFPRKPSAAILEAVKAAGFYWSPALKSWNKGLTFRAFRAAEKLHAELHALTA